MRVSYIAVAAAVSVLAACSQEKSTGIPSDVVRQFADGGTEVRFCYPEGTKDFPRDWEFSITPDGEIVRHGSIPNTRCYGAIVRALPGNYVVKFDALRHTDSWQTHTTTPFAIRWPRLNETGGPYRIRSEIGYNCRLNDTGRYSCVSTGVTDEAIFSRGQIESPACKTPPPGKYVIYSSVRDVRTGMRIGDGRGKLILRCKVVPRPR